MRRYLSAIIGLLLIVFYCASCAVFEGPEAREVRKANRHLRKAERHIRKAEQHGAVWKSDTLFKRLGFKVPGIKVQFIPKILTTGKQMIFQKDSVITKILIVPGKNGVDTVYAATDCPERIIYRDVPVSVEKTIDAKKNYTGQWVAGILAALITGCIIGYFLRGKHKVTIAIEKPPN